MELMNWQMIEALSTLIGSIVATTGLVVSALMVTYQLRLQRKTVSIERAWFKLG